MINIAKETKTRIRKKLTFTLEEWNVIERGTKALCTNTTAYIRYMVTRKDGLKYVDLQIDPQQLDELRQVSKKINAIAKKANETNNISSDDVEKLRTEVNNLSNILNNYISSIEIFNV